MNYFIMACLIFFASGFVSFIINIALLIKREEENEKYLSRILISLGIYALSMIIMLCVSALKILQII